MSMAPGKARHLALWYGVALVVLLLDQLTKVWASASLVYAQPVPVMPFFNLTLLHNTGAAFSFLSDAGGWQQWFFAGVAVLVSLVIMIWIWRLPAGDRWQSASLALILGGAIGNLWDRLAYGYVVDFLDFYVGSYHWPAFNIADSAIVVGAGIMIWLSFRHVDEPDPPSDDQSLPAHDQSPPDHDQTPPAQQESR